MNKFLLMTSLLVPILATNTLAGELTTPEVVAVQIETPSHDWDGFYVGATGAFAPNGAWDFGDDFGIFASGDVGDGQAYGAFSGYNIQRGNLVFGGEVAFFGEGISLSNAPNSFFENIIDVKGRVGYAANRALVYAIVGAATADFNDIGVFFFNYTGISYGAGIDIMVTDRIFAGVEYLMRDMNGTDPTRPTITSKISLATIQGRVGIKF